MTGEVPRSLTTATTTATTTTINETNERRHMRNARTPPPTTQEGAKGHLTHSPTPTTTTGRNYKKVQKAICSGYFTHVAKKDPQEGYRTILENSVVVGGWVGWLVEWGVRGVGRLGCA